jgi:subtilisin family serine protease
MWCRPTPRRSSLQAGWTGACSTSPGSSLYGYDDRSRTDLPLLVDGGRPSRAATALAKAAVAAPGVAVACELPSVGSVAVRAGKASMGRFWDRVRGSVPARRASPRGLAGGLERVWLDGPVRAALDRSVPQIGAPAAWRAGHTGAGATVAVLDSGVDPTHPDLTDAVVEAVDFTDSTTGTHDLYGHGTHVASIVTGNDAVGGGRYIGVAPDARLLVGKVLDDSGWGSEADVIAGMAWAAGRSQVVNMSLNGSWPSDSTDPMSQALNQLTAESGILFVVAAGNSGPASRAWAARPPPTRRSPSGR